MITNIQHFNNKMPRSRRTARRMRKITAKKRITLVSSNLNKKTQKNININTNTCNNTYTDNKYLENVNKNDTVLVVLGNSKLSITTYGIALASGQKGDLITVQNIKSKKTFKAIVLDEKKVTPLTNM